MTSMKWRKLRLLALQCESGRSPSHRLGDALRYRLGRLLGEKRTLLAREAELSTVASTLLTAMDEERRNAGFAFRQDQYESALDHVRRIAELVKDLYLLFNTLQEERQGREELAHWLRTLDLQGYADLPTLRFPGLLFDRGHVYLAMGRPVKARAFIHMGRREIEGWHVKTSTFRHSSALSPSRLKRRLDTLVPDSRDMVERLIREGYIGMAYRLSEDLGTLWAATHARDEQQGPAGKLHDLAKYISAREDQLIAELAPQKKELTHE